MNTKKVFAILLVIALVVTVAVATTGCSQVSQYGLDESIPVEDIKVGLICLHGEESTYDKNFIDAAKAACEAKGVELLIKTGIPEDEACYTAAVELAEEGCNIIFADSFGHEAYMIQAAEEYPTVRFAHATGTQAAGAHLDNFYNAFASIYEGRYLAGYAAGLKLNEMAAADPTIVQSNGKIKVGYVGAYTYAEVVSGLTSWYLGVQAAAMGPVEMDVRFTGSWYDQLAEGEAAKALIADGAVLISQHADSMGAPNACKEANNGAGVPNVTYNISTKSSCENSYLAGSKINWQPYFEYLIECAKTGTLVETNYTGTIATGSVVDLELNTALLSDASVAAYNAEKEKMAAGEIKVFDTNNFTVTVVAGDNGKNQNATVDATGKLTAYTVEGNQVVLGGEFKESYFRSAPYFDLQIDGINFVNVKF